MQETAAAHWEGMWGRTKTGFGTLPDDPNSGAHLVMPSHAHSWLL
jgi:hypothetical protein